MTKASSVYTHGHCLAVLPLRGMRVHLGWVVKNSVEAVCADASSCGSP